MSLSNIPRMKLVVVRCRHYTGQGCAFTDAVATVKAYGELPENAKINETENFGEEEGECMFEFGDDEEVDIDDI